MYLEDIRVGMSVDIPAVTIREDKMLEFARDYDHIPIHLDAEYAKTTRYGRIIAPGVMTFMAVWAQFQYHDFFGEELIAGKSTKIEWLKPVFADDVLTATAEVTAITPRNPYNGIVEVTLYIKNQHDELVTVDVTEAIVQRRPEE